MMKVSKRRGVSEIMGSLLLLTIVTGVGYALLLQGNNKINEFNSLLAFFNNDKELWRENIVLENIRFHNDNGGSLDITLSMRNIGSIDIVIDTITVVNANTQDLVVYDNTRVDRLNLDDIIDITLTTTLSGSWNTYKSDEFRIAITTLRGNSFTTIAKPFNT